MKIVGIDGGLSGGLVCLETPPIGVGITGMTPMARVIGKIPMPTLAITRNDHERRDYDLPMLRQIFREWRPDIIYMEEAQPMARPGHGEGTVQAFGTGAGFGLMRGILAGLGYAEQRHVFRVRPQRWQAEMFKSKNLRRASDGKRDTKLASAQVAAELFPGVEWLASVRCHKVHSGLTDAACIAAYGLNHYMSDRMPF